MLIPDPIRLYRFIHLDNLDLLLRRGGLHAPNFTPDDGLSYRTIHDEAVQAGRHVTLIPCGPGGTVQASSTEFVFSDGHGLAAFTGWFDDPADFGEVDWEMVKQRYWADTLEDDDRQRRKQAEFLIYRFMCWSLVKGIAVINDAVKQQVETVLAAYPHRHQPPVRTLPNWYY